MDSTEMDQTTNGAQQSLRQNHSLQTWTEPTETWEQASPASRDQIIRSLSSALILVAPAGFSEGDRKAWLAAATMALEDVPSDLLTRGIGAARKTADHPSKILPAIMEEIGQSWKWRNENRASMGAVPRLAPPAPQPDFEPCTPEQAAAIIREFGLRGNPLDTVTRTGEAGR